MYAAKARGRARCELFGQSLRGRMVERLKVENDLRPALDRDQLEVHYQPIVALESQRIVGVEALIRWRHPERGLVSPAEFIPVAEETGLIVPIGRMVLERACVQIAAWDASGGPLAGISLSVNLSARQLPHPELLPNIETALRRARIAPSRLTLELTESTLMDEDAGPGGDAGRPAPPRRAARARRLRDGLLLALLPQALRARRDQARPQLHRRASATAAARTRSPARCSRSRARSACPSSPRASSTTIRPRPCAAWAARYGQGYLFARPAPAIDLEASLGGEPALRLAS